MLCVNRQLVTGSNPVANKNLVFKWRMVEGRTHYRSCLEPCATDPQGLISYQNRKNNLRGDLSYSELRKMFNLIHFLIDYVTLFYCRYSGP